jgi:hypothetical protein
VDHDGWRSCCSGCIAGFPQVGISLQPLSVPILLPFLCPSGSLLLPESASVVARPCLAPARSRSRALKPPGS